MKRCIESEKFSKSFKRLTFLDFDASLTLGSDVAFFAPAGSRQLGAHLEQTGDYFVRYERVNLLCRLFGKKLTMRGQNMGFGFGFSQVGSHMLPQLSHFSLSPHSDDDDDD